MSDKTLFAVVLKPDGSAEIISTHPETGEGIGVPCPAELVHEVIGGLMLYVTWKLMAPKLAAESLGDLAVEFARRKDKE